MNLLKDSKLKGPIGRVYPIAIFFLYILVMIEIIVTKYQFPVYSAWLFGAMFIIVGTIQFIRSGLWVHLVLGILIGTCTWHSMAVYNTSIFSAATYLIHFVLLAMFIIFGWSVLFGHDKYESNARRLFKLASESLVDVSNGFTRYLKNKRIAMPHFSEQGLYFMFSMGRSVLTYPDPQKVSYVLFSKSGNLTVHVSEFDYKQYHEKITFDQLCNSLGDVYKRFEKYWANGNERRILDEIRNV